MQGITRRLAGVGVGVLLGLGLTQSAVAQTKGVEINGFAGIYAPTPTGGQQGDLQAVRRRSLAWGGRFTYWTTNTLGLEFTGAFSPARVKVASTAGAFARSTRVLAASGKVVFNLTPTSKRFGISLGGGPAVIHTQKTLVDPTASTTKVGGVGGLTLRIHLMDKLSLRGDAEDYLYSADFGKGSKLTNDLWFTGGISIHF